MKNLNPDISKTTIKYIIICGGILAIFLLVVLFPMYRYNIYQAGEIKKTKDQIEERKANIAVYASLKKTMDRKDVQMLPNPKKTAITRAEAANFPAVFKSIAGKSGLVAIYVKPDMTNAAGSSRLLLHNAVVKGNFANLRKMLIALSAIPYMEKIEEIRISQRADSMEYKIQLWLAVGA